MHLVDLSHPISTTMPVYPGTAPPEFVNACRIDTHGFREKQITLFTHTGTHMDAPAHIIKAAKTLDQFPIDHFCGRACRLDVTASTGRSITVADLNGWQGQIEESDYILLHTGWSKYWGSAAYFSGFPVLSMEAAVWLAEFEVKGIGLDTISADGPGSEAFPIHKILLQRGAVIVENLTNLAALPDRRFDFLCLPLKIVDADGSPVRAAGIVN
jgi:arylformamidase